MSTMPGETAAFTDCRVLALTAGFPLGAWLDPPPNGLPRGWEPPPNGLAGWLAAGGWELLWLAWSASSPTDCA